MSRNETFNRMRFLFMVSIILFFGTLLFAQEEGKPLVLQEMTWTDVRDYLKTSDMVIIPLGSTEQHGPHMPLGTDYYEAMGMSKLISARTGVVVAPVLLAGYSEYHSGFPGTLSLKPETMEQVLFETAEMLMKYGFRRFMFFNYHGGNNIVQQKIIHRINHKTESIATSIGHGSPIQESGEEEEEFFDWHAGVNETSIMLYLKPELVKMERAEKPDIRFTPQMQDLMKLAKKNPDLMNVLDSLFGVPVETKKGGASHELSSNGVWSFSDPKKATKEIGEKTVSRMVERAVKFIEVWKKTKK
ncbi:MAG: creatininase family protein [Candidatus Aminicenantes bacterium]|nr:MAG: creatininase family protein [Candidatus Aminicenantes bacterium]